MRFILPRTGRSRLRAAAVALAALSALGCGTSEAPPRPAAPVPVRAETTDTPRAAPAAARIAFLGDSLSAGYGVAASDAFPAVVERLLRDEGHAVEVLNAGVSGDTSAGGLSRLDWVLRSNPDILVVELGANDALRGQPLSNTERNLREIVRRAVGHGVQVLLLGMDIPTNYGPDYTRGFAGLYERIAREERVGLHPRFIREIGTDPQRMQPDGLHPTAEGHQRLAETLLPPLRTLLGDIPLFPTEPSSEATTVHSIPEE